MSLDFRAHWSRRPLAAAAGDILAGLQLEPVEPGRKEGRALRAAHPCDDPVLPSICGMDIARHLDAVSREVVGLGFGAQQPPQEQGPSPVPAELKCGLRSPRMGRLRKR